MQELSAVLTKIKRYSEAFGLSIKRMRIRYLFKRQEYAWPRLRDDVIPIYKYIKMAIQYL